MCSISVSKCKSWQSRSVVRAQKSPSVIERLASPSKLYFPLVAVTFPSKVIEFWPQNGSDSLFRSLQRNSPPASSKGIYCCVFFLIATEVGVTLKDFLWWYPADKLSSLQRGSGRCCLQGQERRPATQDTLASIEPRRYRVSVNYQREGPREVLILRPAATSHRNIGRCWASEPWPDKWQTPHECLEKRTQ